MKKLFFYAAIMASAFFAASCQQEMLETQAGSNTVTYTVDVPNAIATKAIGDQITAVDKVYYEVYRAADVEDLSKTPVYQGEKPVINNSASFPLEFVKNQEFVVLFWAQSSALVNTDVTSVEGMYNINDLRKIQLVNPGAANNEAAQVFAGSDRVSNCASAANGNVTLTRPVSQINVYTTTESLSFGDVTIGLSTSDMTVAGLYNTYNVATGDAVEADENESRFVYAEAAVPTATADNAALKYVAMNYVGFAPKNGTTVKVDFNIQTTEAVKIKHSVSNVPVKPNFRTNITGNLITATADYNVSLNDNWANAEITHATNTEAAQAALDCAVKGTVLQLHPGVQYGTLYLRPVEGQENTVTDCDYLVYRNEMLRTVEDLTILGAPGATVDAIKVVAGYVENSGSTGYVVDIKNLVIDSVTFTDDYVNPPHSYSSPLFFDLSYINVDGLTVKNCQLIGENANVNFVYFYGSGNPANSTFVTAAKNITLEKNTVDGIARLCELRQTENVTITGNTIKNTALHGMLLTVDDGTYSGNVTITENTADGINERFVRMAGAGDAEVVIKNNTINNYQGADADYIKVTDGTNVTIENNVLGASTSAELVAALQTAVAAGETNIVFDANGANIGNFNKDDNTWFTTNLVPTGVTVTLRNATVSGISRWNNANGTLIFENCTFTNNSAYSINFGWGNGHVKFTNCELYGWCSFSGVTVEMNDCNIAGNGSYALVRSYNTFTMNNCTIDGSNAIKDDDYPDGVSIGDGAVLTMTGCTMTDAEYDYGESLIDGNRVVDYGENSSYIIVDGKRLVCNPSSLEYALKNGNAILMENNITVEAHLTNTSHGTNINIDGGGNELTLRGIYGVSGANVSLSNMTLVDSKTDDYTIFNQGGKIELNNVTYNSTINKAFQMAGGGDVVLTDCNISGDVTGTYSASNIWCGDGRNVTVNGGTYGSIFMNAQYHSGWPAASAHAASKITLNDGTITKLILETELGAEGYYVSATLTQNGGTITNLVENPQNLDLTGRSQYNK